MNIARTLRRWVPYLLYLLMVVLLVAQAPLPVAVGWHQLMEGSTSAACWGLMALWTRHNAQVLADDALRRTVAKRAAERHVTLTAVQLEYLVVQERHLRKY